jgi:integrase
VLALNLTQRGGRNSARRSFPLTAASEALLKIQRADHDQRRKAGTIVLFVFHRDGQRIKNFRRSWITACKAAGVPGRLLHDFRRTAVRNMEHAWVSRSAAMAMVGHKTEAIYRRYAIVDAGALRDAAAKIDGVAGIKLGITAESDSTGQKQPA